MGVATLGGHTFRVDPTSVSWDFSVTAVDIPAVGGKIVQVLGAKLNDMVVTGSFGVGGWREQEAFLEKMKAMASSQFGMTSGLVTNGEPLRFQYPPKGWDFLVYLTQYADPRGGRRSVTLDPKTEHAPQWQLTLTIIEDNAGLTKVATDAYIARLAEGVGWKQTKFNGPMTAQEVEETMQGRTIEQYLAEQFALSGPSDGMRGV